MGCVIGTAGEAQITICPNCKHETFRLTETLQNGQQFWSCSHCGSERIFCKECEQGWIRKVIIIPPQKVAYSCAECSATWDKLENICAEKVVNFSTFLEQNGFDEKKVSLERCHKIKSS